MITEIEDIQRLVIQDFSDWQQYGKVSVKEQGDLVLFNYTNAAQYADIWTPFECMSRGLIINRTTGEIVARPFDKLFNWLQGGRKATGHIINVTEKIDGSLGILYRSDGQYRIATRGSFDSEQARWATDFLNNHFDLTDLPDELTLLFEIIYPDNRIVVDYQGKQDIVLLAARNRYTGTYLSFFPDLVTLATEYAFSLPRVYSFANVSDILALTGVVDANTEGWVVEFSDGSRWKIKGDRYLELHKIVCGLSFKNVLVAVQAGTINYLLDVLPDEYHRMVKDWLHEIDYTVHTIQEQIVEIFDEAPKDSRKTFALWVMKYHKHLSSYLFALLDEKPLEPLIYQLAFKDRDLP